MTKLIDVANFCGVSTATVSNVINNTGRVSEETREKVLFAVKQLQYSPNKSLCQRKMHMQRNISVLVEDLHSVLSFSMLEGITSVCNEKEILPQIYDLKIRQYLTRNFDYQMWQQTAECRENVQKALNLACRKQASGVIYLAAHPRDLSTLHLSSPQNIPIVYLFGSSTENHLCVEDDDVQGAALATDYLIEHGHRRIAIVCGSFNSTPAHLRLSGYQNSLMRHQLYFYPEYVCSGSWEMMDGYAACEKLMHLNPPPTALFSMNDAMALGAISYLQSNGYRIPEDLSVVGFDAADVHQYAMPRLTSIQMPLYDMGKEAARYLLDMLQQQTVYGKEKSKRLPCRLVEGETVSFLNEG